MVNDNFDNRIQFVIASGSLSFFQVVSASVQTFNFEFTGGVSGDLSHGTLFIHSFIHSVNSSLAIFLHFVELDGCSARFVSVEGELSASQSIVGITIGIFQNGQLPGVGLGLVGGGRMGFIVVVLVLQIGLVVFGFLDNSIIIQSRIVVNNDRVAGFQAIAEILGENYIEGMAILRVSISGRWCSQHH